MFSSFTRFLVPLAVVGTIVGCSSNIPGENVTNPNPNQVEASRATTTETIDEDDMIIVGDISDDPTRIIERMQPMADYLAEGLKDKGIKAGKVKVAPDIETMASWLASGEVDLFFDSPFPAMRMALEAEAQPILRQHKKGYGEYHTVIFVNKDSGIKTLDDLKGKIVALDEPASTSGFMLPVSYLLTEGFTATEKASSDTDVSDDEIGYVFSGDDENSVEWVISGEVNAAAIDNISYDKLSEEVAQNMEILVETEPVARALTMAAADLDEGLIASIKEIMVAMNENEEGKTVLKSFSKTAEFDDVSLEEDLQQMQDFYQLVKSQ